MFIIFVAQQNLLMNPVYLNNMDGLTGSIFQYAIHHTDQVDQFYTTEYYKSHKLTMDLHTP